MRLKAGLILLFVCFFYDASKAQTPQVPNTIYFADMTLRLNDQARREIQLDVDALYRNPSYFQIKLDRVNLYMPTIERVLREEGVPEDMKYLVIQESSLIPDAVSSSNAVGFWQFKKGTAEEVFLRVDNQIDERKNIVSSTRGAALYLKKHQRHLDNWFSALVSYQMGLGGARNYFGDKHRGKRSLDVDRSTHWYFKKFLAHKIAFEGQLGKLVSTGDYLHEYRVTGPTSLKALSKDLGVSENHLREMNKWSANGTIPGDRQYTVTFVQKGASPGRPVLASNQSEESYEVVQTSLPVSNPQNFPVITGDKSRAEMPGQIKVNGIKGVLARRNLSQEEFSETVGVRAGKLKRVNDLKNSDRIFAGQYYYTKRKKGKAQVDEHIVAAGETLWKISQLYGIRLHSLKAKNRLYKDADLQPGMILKLRDYRKRNEPIAFAQTVPAKVTDIPAQKVVAIKQDSKPITVTQPSVSTHSSAPTQPQPPAEYIDHRVQEGDTLYAISRKYNVSVDQLRAWNNLTNASVLSIGQVIMIKK